MTRRREILLFAVSGVIAIVLGVATTVALAGWPQPGTGAVVSGNGADRGWAEGPMVWGRGDTGVDGEFEYLTHMMAHHQEAVRSARQLARSGRAEMRALGESIVTTQSAEIGEMNAWLAQWYPGRPTTFDYRPMMRDLSGLAGDALDEAFLRDMIPHHMAAVMMSQRLLVQGRAEHREVADFARTVRDTQHAEIFQMNGFLTDWFGGGWPTPYGVHPSGGWAPCAGGASWGPGGMMGR